MSAKTRLSPKEKLRIFTESLKNSVKISEICRREEIWPREYYRIKEKALSWDLSIDMDVDFCMMTLERAFANGTPEICDSDQSSHLTSLDFTKIFNNNGIDIELQNL